MLWQNKNRQLAKILFVFCFLTSVWQFSWALLFQIQDFNLALIIAKLGWTFILFLPTTLYHFLTVLSEKPKELKKVYSSYAFSFFLLLLLLFSNKFISGLHSYFWGFYPKAGVLHLLHVAQTTLVVLRGLYITFLKQKSVNSYKTKSQLRYCIIGLLIYLFAAVDYLCNYGFGFYPPGIIFITISLSIITYVIIRHKILDLSIFVSLFLTKTIIYSLFLALFLFCHLLITGSFLSDNKLYFTSEIMFLLFICEVYSYLTAKIKNLSDSILAKQKNKKILGSINKYLHNSVSVPTLLNAVKNIINEDLKLKLVSFYIKNELHKEQKRKDVNDNLYIDLLDSNFKAINVSPAFVNRVVELNTIIEKDDYQEEFLKEKKSQILIPFISEKAFYGFILVNSEKTIKFWQYEIFNSLIAHIGIIIDRINAYQELSLQREQFLKEKAQALKSLSGSIAHELRNPLNNINLASSGIRNLLLNLNSDNSLKIEESKKELAQIESSILASIKQANETINLILADINEKPINPDDFAIISAKTAINEIVANFGYSSHLEKEKVKILIEDDGEQNQSQLDSGEYNQLNISSQLSLQTNCNFFFKAVPERFTFIVYNLLKNALHYLKEYPSSIINIGTEPRLIEDRKYNAIYVYDTGPGVPPEILPKLFGSFFTSGKKGGTGLGLDFCKRNMRIFNGDIICESKFGEGKSGWTKFSMLFPELTKEELLAKQCSLDKERENQERENQDDNQGQSGLNQPQKPNYNLAKNQFKILLVDDQQSTLIITKSYIEKALPYIACDVASSGFDAINMVKNNINANSTNSQYKLVLMDIDIPEMDGIETSKKIKEMQPDIAIIANTSRENRFDIKSNTSDYIHKPSSNQLLCRTINKWIFDIKDDFSYLGSEEEYLKYLKDKNILLAEDQEMNRMMIRKMLEKYGLKITEASDGKELLELYQKNQEENQQDSNKALFDLILTDINMSPYNGDDATKQIRIIEQQNKNLNYNQHHYQNTNNQIPIIALSGDGMEQEIRHFFDCGINDYFIKGNDPESLIKIIALYLKKYTRKANHNISDNVNNNDFNNTAIIGDNSADNISNNNYQNNQLSFAQNHTQHYEDQLDNSNLYPKIFNLEKIQDFDPEQQKMVISVFISSSLVALNKIRENKINNNSEELLLNLHSIKGSAGIIGAEVLYEYILKIERKLKEINGYNEKPFASENISQNPNQSFDLSQNIMQNSNQKSALIPDLLFNQEWFLELEKLYAEMKREMEMI